MLTLGTTASKLNKSEDVLVSSICLKVVGLLLIFGLILIYSLIEIVKWYIHNKQNEEIMQEISSAVTIVEPEEKNTETEENIDIEKTTMASHKELDHS